MVSNGEYMPLPQSEKQKRVEARVRELADGASKQLGLSRRGFLAGVGGMAASFVAMNEVFGPYFKVDPLEMLVPDAYAAAAAPKDLFVFDDQLHLVRGSRGNSLRGLRGLAQGPTVGLPSNPFNKDGHLDEHGQAWGVWTPALVGLPYNPENFLLTDFIRQVYLDSQVTVGLLSNVPASVIDTGERHRYRRARSAQCRRSTRRRDSHGRADRRRSRFRQRGRGLTAHARARHVVRGQGQPRLRP
jgi:hypothetical protein